MLHNLEDTNGEKALRVGDMKLVYCKKGTTMQWDKWYRPEQFHDVELTSNVDYWDFTGLFVAIL